MSDGNVKPIRPGVEPKLNVERELIEWAKDRIIDFTVKHGAPHSIALVLSNKDQIGAQSWTPYENGPSRAENCGAAAAVLLKRAVS